MLELLQLLHLADSALPIGSSAHSFGLETLTAEDDLTPANMSTFFAAMLRESAPLGAACCRQAYRLADAEFTDAEFADSKSADNAFAEQWMQLNTTLSARKPARESRDASATLGRRLLRLAAHLVPAPRLQAAVAQAGAQGFDLHLCTAFGLVGGALALGEDAVAAAYLQQSLTGLLSACQRLMPVGQNQAMELSWRLKPLLAQIAMQSRNADMETTYSFAPLYDVASMRHASLPVRLFIS